MLLDQTVLVLIGLLLAAWTLAASWALLVARGRQKRAEAVQRNARRLARMVDESPAIPLLVRTDGRTMRVTRLYSATPVPLRQCRNDRTLRRPS